MPTVRQLLEQAIVHHQSGRLNEAEAIYRQILAAVPDEPNALHLFGLLAHKKGQLDLSLQMLSKAVSLVPNQAAFRSNLGQVLAASGREAEALSELKRAHELRSDSPEILNNLGHLLWHAGRAEEAIPLLQKSIALSPELAISHNHLGNAYRAASRTDEAIVSLRRAVELSPQEPVFHNNLGTALQDAGRLDEAIACFDHALSLRANFAEAHNNRGTCLRMNGHFDDAIKEFREAIGIQSDYPMAHFNLGLTLLLTGDFETGWKEAEWRWRVREHRLQPQHYAQPLWDGGNLDGKTILLYPEQGYGDAIQFSRYAPLVAQRGGRVLLACQPVLRRLFEGFPGAQRVMTHGDMLPPFDVRCPLMSLPMVFGTNLSNIPAPIPYLKADPTLAARWRDRLGGDPRRKIGIAWAGRPAHRQDRERSIPLESFAPLARVPDARFISLQTGPAAAQLKAANLPFEIAEWTAELSDFAETAALIDSLDLIITVDTAVAHLAGAMGKPVWNLIAFVPDWRWLTERSDTPWYPTMRLFRQKRFGDWNAVIGTVVQAIADA